MIRRVFLLFAFVFAATQLLTCSFESPSDGNDYVGWPFRYYEYFGGKGGFGFRLNFILLLSDIALLLLFCWLIAWFLTKWRGSSN